MSFAGDPAPAGGGGSTGAACSDVAEVVSTGIGSGRDIGSAGDDSTSSSTGAISPAILVDETEVPWMRCPSSPGLNTRTETAMSQPEQAAGPAGVTEADPQFQFQFHVH